jgi:hypothetical protein
MKPCSTCTYYRKYESHSPNPSDETCVRFKDENERMIELFTTTARNEAWSLCGPQGTFHVEKAA